MTLAGPSTVEPVTPDSLDREGIERTLARLSFLVRRVFRTKVDGLEKLDLSKPGILAGNHNLGAWGVSEVVGILHAWYVGLADQRPPDLIGQGSAELFDGRQAQRWMRHAGVMAASMEGMVQCLRDRRWVFIQPGAEVDQMRPIWRRNRCRIQKVAWIEDRRVLSDQLSFIAAAADGGHPIYPVAFSGTAEMSPILWESVRLLRWSGMKWVRPKVKLPCFPITLNHLVNLGLMAASPFSASPLAWLLFLLANVYVDFVYTYPLFPFQLRIRIGDPIEVPNLKGPEFSSRERRQIMQDIHAQFVSSVDSMLEELDEGRPWVRALQSLRELRGRSARTNLPGPSSNPPNDATAPD